MLRANQLCACASISLLALACVPERARRGDINLIYGITQQNRAVFLVEQGRIVSQWLDVATESNAPDSCVRGTWGNGAVSLCPKPLDDKDSHLGGKLTSWSGPMGELAIEEAPNGQAMRIDGWIARGGGGGNPGADASVHGGFGGGRGSRHGGLGGRRSISMHITLPLGRGPQWDEMRKTPILYAVAAASIGLTSGEAVPPALQPAQERKGESEGAPPPPPPPANDDAPPPPPPAN